MRMCKSKQLFRIFEMFNSKLIFSYMQYIYQQTFIDLINKFAPTPENPTDYYIGIGNPNAQILIIGKEGATKDP